MCAYEIIVTLNVDSNISRSIIVPDGITFKTLHEIICILFNLDVTGKYKFIFEDIELIIQDTGSLNRDNIDSRFELIDEYLQRYSEIKYCNSFCDMKLNISMTNQVIVYPQIVAVEEKYNPSNKINSIDAYLDALNIEDKDVRSNSLIRVNIMEIQELLLILFDIPYAIENKDIIILKEEETLNSLWDD